MRPWRRASYCVKTKQERRAETRRRLCFFVRVVLPASCLHAPREGRTAQVAAACQRPRHGRRQSTRGSLRLSTRCPTQTAETGLRVNFSRWQCSKGPGACPGPGGGGVGPASPLAEKTRRPSLGPGFLPVGQYLWGADPEHHGRAAGTRTVRAASRELWRSQTQPISAINLGGPAWARKSGFCESA